MSEIIPLVNLLSQINYLFILLIEFLTVAFIQVFYYLFFYFRIAFHKQRQPETKDCVSLSVVICARNEARNLRRFLPSILEQDYPNFEVVVVNDCSSDHTDIVLKEFAKKYKHLKTTFLREDLKFEHGKKLALTVGIKAAKNEQLVLTDADCFAVSKDWLKSIANQINEKKTVVLAYGGYIERRGFLNRMIRYDTLWIALQYLSFAKSHIPYMGVGRNLSYKKSLFFENKGFASHARLESGDDDLFINEIANSKNTVVVLNKKSQTRSRPKIHLKSWIDQKRRHLTTAPHYKFGHKILLALEPISRMMLYSLFIPLVCIYQYRYVALSVFALRTILFILNVLLCEKRFNERKLFFVSFIMDIFMPFFYFYCMMLNIFSPYKKWR